MTERLYYKDSYLTHFEARVVERGAGGNILYLDRTAFYPTSGGQPFDTGVIAEARVLDVIDEGGRIAHSVGAAVDLDRVTCRIDWERRFDHMQQHTGQHLLSAVLQEQFGIATESFHLGSEASTIDVDKAVTEPSRVENLVNARVFENLPVSVGFEHAAADLRKASAREGELRIVSIAGLDRSACGGTHVGSTGEIGPVLIRKLEKIRGTVRLEFLCGLRALRRARADFDALSRIAQALSAHIDETSVLAAQQFDRLRESEKTARRLGIELALLRGKQLYGETQPSTSGLRYVVRRIESGGIGDEERSLAQGFTGGVRAAIAIAAPGTRTVLLAASADSGIHAAETLKSLLAAAGGRGGGNAALAQGSAASTEGMEELLAGLNSYFGAA